METIKKLPVYKLRISEEDNNNLVVDYIALVDDPAIQLNWLKFDSKARFAADKERQLVMGAFMVANMPIYRRDVQMGEYYVVFDKEEIYKIVQKFFRNNMTSNFNIMHDGVKVDGVYMIESFIIDESRGVRAPEAFKDLSEGSWLGTVKIDNPDIWNAFINTGELKGFSIEGLFKYEQIGENDEAVLKEIIEIVKGN